MDNTGQKGDRNKTSEIGDVGFQALVLGLGPGNLAERISKGK